MTTILDPVKGASRRAVRQVADWIPLSVMLRVEQHAKRRRLGSRVTPAMIAQVKANKAATQEARNAYSHEPRLGVVVTSFNQLWNVNSLADRLIANPHVDELVVCEDGSIDGSLDAWISHLTGPNHFLVRSNDLHEIRSLDRAFGLCRADVFCVVQDDDVVPVQPNWASDVLDLFDQHPRLGILGGFTAFLEPPSLSADGEPELDFVDSVIIQRDEFRFVPTVSIGPYYVRASCYEALGGFDTGFSKPGQAGVGFDEEFGLRAWRQGWQVGYLHQPFKTGTEGEYEPRTGGTVMYGEKTERTTHDTDNKRRMAALHGGHHDEIVEAVERSNASLVSTKSS